VQVLTDLTTRGYPTAKAATVVALVLAHDPQALSKLAGELDRLRRARGLTQAEALDDLARSFARTISTSPADTALPPIRGHSPAAVLDRAVPDQGPHRDSVGCHGKPR